MTLPFPKLDDRTYEGLVEEARATIAKLYPQWTDHNPTDPGIVLVELLAWLTEMTLYRIDRIPEANYRTLLQLLNGVPDKTASETLNEAVRATVQDLRDRYRAITCDDYEYLVLNKWPGMDESSEVPNSSDHSETNGQTAENIVRVHCIPDRNLEGETPDDLAPGHMSIVVVPDAEAPSEGDNLLPSPKPAISDSLKQELKTWLDRRRLLTTHLHLLDPDYVDISITARLVLQEDADESDFPRRAKQGIVDFFYPVPKGRSDRGWPFGRDVFLSEVYRVLEQVKGVNYVEKVELYKGAGDSSKSEPLNTVSLSENQLVAIVSLDFEIVSTKSRPSV